MDNKEQMKIKTYYRIFNIVLFLHDAIDVELVQIW